MPRPMKMLVHVTRKARQREHQLSRQIRSHREWHRYFPPREMMQLVRKIKSVETPHEHILREVGKKVLEELFGSQAIDFVMEEKGFSDIQEFDVESAKHQKLSRAERDLLRHQQRVRSMAEGMGLMAQELFLRELKKTHPKMYTQLLPYYEPFMKITQHAFHFPVSPGARAMGIGEAETKIRYGTAVNKHDPTDIRIIPLEMMANVRRAPMTLIWVNEAAEALAVMNMTKSQTPLIEYGHRDKEGRTRVEEQLHSLQLRNLRYQHGQHFIRRMNPVFLTFARQNALDKSTLSVNRLARKYWDTFLALSTRQQDRLMNGYLSARTDAARKAAAHEIQGWISDIKL